MILNPTFSATGALPSWTYLNSTNSNVSYSTDNLTITGGTTLYTNGLGQATAQSHSVLNAELKMVPGDIIVFAMTPVSSSDITNTEITVSVTWIELH